MYVIACLRIRPHAITYTCKLSRAFMANFTQYFTPVSYRVLRYPTTFVSDITPCFTFVDNS
jgi:hypothetical protein